MFLTHVTVRRILWRMITQQNSVFIDPENCGSSIGYYITTNEYAPKDKPVVYSISATVVLADCSHKIDWSFGGPEGTVDKVDAAIHMLQEFRKKYLETEKLVAKLNK
jgi:hypothetical protein